MKSSKAIVAAIVLVAAVGGGAAWYLRGVAAQGKPVEQAQKPGAAQASAPKVTVAIAARREVVESVSSSGTLVPRDEILVGPEIEGLRILEILAEEGDRVAQGQVLVRLSRETLDAQVAQSDAALARAEAAIAQAASQIAAAQANATLTVAELGRAQELNRRGVSAQAIVDQKTNAANTAKAQLQVTKDALRAAEAEQKNQQALRRELMVRLRRTEIRTPAAGIISRRSAKVGAVASAAAEPLFRIIRDGKIELDAEVPEQSLLSMKPGLRAKIVLANGAELSGTVRLVSPHVDPASRLGHVRVALADNSIARTGSFAKAVIEIRRSEAVTVPASSVLYENNQARVQVVENNVVRTRPVKLGLVSGDYAEILDGIRQGERVILLAGAFLRDGDVISPVQQAAEKR